MQLSIREFKANPARAIDLAQKGELVEITSHRKVVAELVKPSPKSAECEANEENALRRLIASGLVEPASKPLKLGRAIKPSEKQSKQSMSDLVIEMRGPQ